MKPTTFKLTKSNGKEYPARFAGHSVTIEIPGTYAELESVVQPGIDVQTAIVGAVNGQGELLTRQKMVKDFLDKATTKELSIEEALKQAAAEANGHKIGAPRTRGEGGGSGKVAAAEAKVAQKEQELDSAKTLLSEQYLKMTKNVRAAFRTDLLDRNVFTVEQLDALDAQATK